MMHRANSTINLIMFIAIINQPPSITTVPPPYSISYAPYCTSKVNEIIKAIRLKENIKILIVLFFIVISFFNQNNYIVQAHYFHYYLYHCQTVLLRVLSRHEQGHHQLNTANSHHQQEQQYLPHIGRPCLL